MTITSTYGLSGLRYDFWILNSLCSIPSTAGLYTYLVPQRDGYLWKVYVGESDNLYRRIVLDRHVGDGHSKAVALGATHVAVMPWPASEQSRKFAEADLIKGLNPPCNDVHVPRRQSAASRSLFGSFLSEGRFSRGL